MATRGLYRCALSGMFDSNTPARAMQLVPVGLGSYPIAATFFKHLRAGKVDGPANRLYVHPTIKNAFEADVVCLVPVRQLSPETYAYRLEALDPSLTGNPLLHAAFSKEAELGFGLMLAYIQFGFIVI